MLPEVIQVIPTDDYKVYVYMDDNTVRLYDAAPLIAKGGIFSRIQDIEIFKSTCTILNDTLAWDLSGCMDGINCIDICRTRSATARRSWTSNRSRPVYLHKIRYVCNRGVT